MNAFSSIGSQEAVACIISLRPLSLPLFYSIPTYDFGTSLLSLAKAYLEQIVAFDLFLTYIGFLLGQIRYWMVPTGGLCGGFEIFHE